MSTDTNRQPAGQPTGGQFAPTSGSDAGLTLGGDAQQRWLNDLADKAEADNAALTLAREAAIADTWGRVAQSLVDDYPSARWVVVQEDSSANGSGSLDLTAIIEPDRSGDLVMSPDRSGETDQIAVREDFCVASGILADDLVEAPQVFDAVEPVRRTSNSHGLPEGSYAQSGGPLYLIDAEELRKVKIARKPSDHTAKRWADYTQAEHRAQLSRASFLAETVRSLDPEATEIHLTAFDESGVPNEVRVYGQNNADRAMDYDADTYEAVYSAMDRVNSRIPSDAWVRSGVATAVTPDERSNDGPVISLSVAHLRAMRDDGEMDGQDSLFDGDSRESYGWVRPEGFRG